MNNDFEFVVAQYNNPQSSGRKYYLTMSGFGNNISTGFVAMPFHGDRFANDELGKAHAQQLIRDFCAHTELEERFCEVVRVKVSVGQIVPVSSAPLPYETSGESLELLKICGSVG